MVEIGIHTMQFDGICTGEWQRDAKQKIIPMKDSMSEMLHERLWYLMDLHHIYQYNRVWNRSKNSEKNFFLL